MTEEEKKVITKEVENAIQMYNLVSNVLRFFLAALGTVGIGSALFVTAFAGADFLKSSDLICIRVASFISAFCLTMLAAFNIVAKGNNARNAYRYLNHYYFMFRIDKATFEELIIAKDQAEKIMGSVDFQAKIIQNSDPS